VSFVVNDRVRVRLTSPALSFGSRQLVPQPPLYGRVTAISGPGPGPQTLDILWDNGHTEAAVPDTALDQLTQPTDFARDTFTNKIIRPLIAGQNVASAEYDAAVVGVMSAGAGGAVGTDVLVCQMLSSVAWFGLPASVAAAKVLNNR
jgi:hypothetical protein